MGAKSAGFRFYLAVFALLFFPFQWHSRSTRVPITGSILQIINQDLQANRSMIFHILFWTKPKRFRECLMLRNKTSALKHHHSDLKFYKDTYQIQNNILNVNMHMHENECEYWICIAICILNFEWEHHCFPFQNGLNSNTPKSMSIPKKIIVSTFFVV